MFLVSGFFFAFAAFSIVAGFVWLRAAEILANESESTRVFCKLAYGSHSYAKWGHDDIDVLLMKYKRRVFNRRPVTVKIGIFMAVEVGMAFGYLQRIFDNVLTGIAMMDKKVPCRLICW